MKKKYFILLLLSQLVFCQAPAIQWQKALGGTSQDFSSSIQQTTDGGYIIAGTTMSNNGDVTSNHGQSDFWIVKLSDTGSILWQKTFGGTGIDKAISIQETSDGGYIVGGFTTSTDGDVTGNHGVQDFWVVKLSSTGVLIWQKTLGGTGDDELQGIQQTSDGGYIVVGYTYSNNGDIVGNHGDTDIWVAKLSATGSLLWQKALGGTSSEIAYGIVQTTDGGYVIAGSTSSTNGDITSSHGFGDVWIVKLSTTGTLLWQKTLGGTGEEEANSIQQTTDDGFIIGCDTNSNDGDVTNNHGAQDFWVVKLSSIGDLIWQKTFGGTSDDLCYSAQQTSDGGYVVAGVSSSNNGDLSGNYGLLDIWVVKLTNTGTLIWQKNLGGTASDYCFSIKQTTDGGYVTAGHTQSNNNDVTGNHSTGNDAWIVKLGANLGTSTVTRNPLIIYPNPTQSILNIPTTNGKNFDKIVVTDLMGKIILEQTQNTNQVDVEQLSTGMYILQAFSGEEKVTSKFLKE